MMCVSETSYLTCPNECTLSTLGAIHKYINKNNIIVFNYTEFLNTLTNKFPFITFYFCMDRFFVETSAELKEKNILCRKVKDLSKIKFFSNVIFDSIVPTQEILNRTKNVGIKKFIVYNLRSAKVLSNNVKNAKIIIKLSDNKSIGMSLQQLLDNNDKINSLYGVFIDIKDYSNILSAFISLKIIYDYTKIRNIYVTNVKLDDLREFYSWNLSFNINVILKCTDYEKYVSVYTKIEDAKQIRNGSIKHTYYMCDMSMLGDGNNRKLKLSQNYLVNKNKLDKRLPLTSPNNVKVGDYVYLGNLFMEKFNKKTSTVITK